LHGQANYGDSVEDEWLIVYILRTLSQEHKDIWIRITDTDGEFLLIEAANALPRWLNPEVADNRVWINDGKLLVIPLAVPSSRDSSKRRPAPVPLKISEALVTIKTTPNALSHDTDIESEAFHRLAPYPGQISASLHHAVLSIPRKLAFLLHYCPSSVAPAVEAFYLRDPIGLKIVQTSNASELSFPPDDLVSVSVKFTKVLYAQLKSQLFDLPPAWKPVITKTKATDVPQLETAMKLATGFELLLRDTGIKRDTRSVRELQILLQDLEEGETLPTDGEIQGWKDVRRNDDERWLDINFEEFEKELAGKGKAPKGTSVPEGLPTENDANKETGDGKPVFGPERPPNLQAASTSKPAKSPDMPPVSGFGDAKTQSDLQKIVERFESFLADETAGPEGAELDDMDYDDDDEEEDEDGQDDGDDDDDDEDSDEDIDFDPKAFAKQMRELMGVSTEGLDGADPDDILKAHLAGKDTNKRVVDLDEESAEEDEEDEAEALRKVMAQMEAELRSAGALNLDPKPQKGKELTDAAASEPEKSKAKGKEKEKEKEKEDLLAKQDWESSDEDEVDIDFNLASNLLESFKSQAGMAGPGGNLMGLMGMRLPRDEDDGADREDGK
jgi:hypothetical protein